MTIIMLIGNDSENENFPNDSIPQTLSTKNLPTPRINILETLAKVRLIPTFAL